MRSKARNQLSILTTGWYSMASKREYSFGFGERQCHQSTVGQKKSSSRTTTYKRADYIAFIFGYTFTITIINRWECC